MGQAKQRGSFDERRANPKSGEKNKVQSSVASYQNTVSAASRVLASNSKKLQMLTMALAAAAHYGRSWR